MTVPAPTADWRSYPGGGLPRVLDAALGLFAATGYHGTTIREIAAAAGLSVPGLYHHYRSKQDVLADLVMVVMGDLLTRCRTALGSAGPSAGERFDVLVECLLRFHMLRAREAFVASTELRALDPAHRAAYVDRRDELQGLIDDVVRAGIAEGVFTCAHPVEAGRAVASLCIGVAAWYRPDGPLDVDELVRRHLDLARGLVGG